MSNSAQKFFELSLGDKSLAFTSRANLSGIKGALGEFNEISKTQAKSLVPAGIPFEMAVDSIDYIRACRMVGHKN